MANKMDLGGRILGLLTEEGNKQRSIRYMAEELDVSGPGVMYAAEKLAKTGALNLWRDGKEWAMRLPTSGHTLPDDSSIMDVKDLERCQNLVKKHFATIGTQKTEITDLKAKLLVAGDSGGGLEADEKLSKLRLELGGKKLVISSLESKVGELEDTLTLKDEELMGLESQLEQRPGDSLDAASVRGTLKEQEERIQGLKDTNQNLRNNIDGLRDELEAKDAWIDSHPAAVNQDEARAASESEVLFLRGVVDRLLPEKK